MYIHHEHEASKGPGENGQEKKGKKKDDISQNEASSLFSRLTENVTKMTISC